MNGRKAKAIRKKSLVLLVDWVKTLIPEEEANKLTLQQAYDLAQQRQKLQESIADDRNDVNVYRINMAAASRGNKGK